MIIKRIEKLKEKIISEELKIIPINIKNILIETLAYDWLFNKTQLSLIKERKKYVDKNFIQNELNILQLNISEIFDHIKSKYSHIKSNTLLCLLLIEEIIFSWKDIFGIWSKKIKYNLDNKIESQEWVLKAIIRLSYEILNKEPLLWYNFSKWILLTNYLLNTINLPGINFSFKNKKRLLRTLNNYIDYEKEILLTIEWNCYKLLKNELEPESIFPIEELKKLKNTSLVYIKPGTWWYWDDRKKYTFIKNENEK